jgi:hypothetical protein
MFENNQRYKPIYLIELCIKKKTYCYLSYVLDIGNSHIHFSGREVGLDFQFTDENGIVKHMEGELIEKFIPWTAVVEITSRRVNKDRVTKLQNK